MHKFTEDQITRTNDVLRSWRPVDVREIDFLNPYFTQPQSAEKDRPDRLNAALAGQQAGHIYVHVPFCAVHCLYCHYPKLTNEHSAENQRSFLDELERELHFDSDQIDLKDCRTVHIGGGTPNCLSAQNLERLFDILSDLRPTDEYAVELYPSPDDLDQEKLKILASRNVNRVSIGIQTFDDEINRASRRYFQTRVDAIRLVQQSLGLFPNVSVDLLYGQRNQGIDRLLDDCRIAIDLGVNSVYLYQTREWLNKNSVELQVALNEFLAFCEDRDYQIVSFDQVIRHRNENGFCRHRSGRSKSENLLGLGPGAVSEIGEYIFRNASPREYLSEGYGVDPAAVVRRTPRTLKAEFINRGLRHFNLPGINGFTISNYVERFGTDPADDFPKELSLLQAEGLIEQNADSIRATEYGLLFSQWVNYLLLGHYK